MVKHKIQKSVSLKKTTRAVVTTGKNKQKKVPQQTTEAVVTTGKNKQKKVPQQTTEAVVTTGKNKQKKVPHQTTEAVVTTGNKRRKVPQQTEDIQNQDTADARVCKMKGKQMKSWRKLKKEEKQYVHRLIDSNIKSVCSKIRFRKHQEVRDVLKRLQDRLEMRFESVKVPNKRLSGFHQYGSTAEDMQRELDQLLLQQEELERAVRQEERCIGTLEDAELQQDDMNITVQVPNNKLNLPAMVYK